MEVAQFYYLCRLYGGGEKGLQYAAIKGPSNAIGKGEDQLRWTKRVLRGCLKLAVALFDER
jgi:hypothetical protein